MANPLHLKLLSEGTETWNSWIHNHPYIVADLSEAHLEHINFDNARLIGANFVGANLSHATLQGAYLSWADFQSKAIIRWCDLQEIDLGEVNLSAAIFV